LALLSHRLIAVTSRLPEFDNVISSLNPFCLRSKGRISFAAVIRKHVGVQMNGDVACKHLYLLEVVIAKKGVLQMD
jgi:hypothetical protein